MEYIVVCRLSEDDLPYASRDEFFLDIAREMVLFSYAFTSAQIVTAEQVQVSVQQAFAEAQDEFPEGSFVKLSAVKVEQGSIIINLLVAIGAAHWSSMESMLLWAGEQLVQGALATLGGILIVKLLKKITAAGDANLPAIRDHQERADIAALAVAKRQHCDFKQLGVPTVVHAGKQHSGFKYEYSLFRRFGWGKDAEIGRVTVIVDRAARKPVQYALSPSRGLSRLVGTR